MTFSQLRTEAAKYGLTVEDDVSASVIRVEAPMGRAFEPGAPGSMGRHSSVHPYDYDGRSFKKEAIQAAFDDLADDAAELVDCEDTECDICHPED